MDKTNDPLLDKIAKLEKRIAELENPTPPPKPLSNRQKIENAVDAIVKRHEEDLKRTADSPLEKGIRRFKVTLTDGAIRYVDGHEAPINDRTLYIFKQRRGFGKDCVGSFGPDEWKQAEDITKKVKAT